MRRRPEDITFMPFQQRWLDDESDFKIWEKSRRIGATYIQAYEDVRDAAKCKYDTWFSSADETAAAEYINYVRLWAEKINAPLTSLGMEVIDTEKDISALRAKFNNGIRITALTSNPTAFRSKEGKIVIDEYGHHKQPEEMWMAAEPCTTWGYPMRILSTHNGKSLFNELIKSIRTGEMSGSIHTTDIFTAVKEGLVDKIYLKKFGRNSTEKERENWLAEKRKKARTLLAWLQEYCCQVIDESSSFLPLDLIASCETSECLWLPN